MTTAPNANVLISKEQLDLRIRALGETLTRDYAGKNLLCVGILKGSFMFFADLVRAIDLPLEIDFLGASSYGDRLSSSGVVKFTLDLGRSIENRHVLLVEDIIDTGNTLQYLLETLRLRNPASLKLCTLLVKPTKLKTKMPLDYVGFEIEDKFVIGYGMDAAEKYRNLGYIGYIDSDGK